MMAWERGLAEAFAASAAPDATMMPVNQNPVGQSPRPVKNDRRRLAAVRDRRADRWKCQVVHPAFAGGMRSASVFLEYNSFPMTPDRTQSGVFGGSASERAG
jgi:hypothetical protein